MKEKSLHAYGYRLLGGFDVLRDGFAVLESTFDDAANGIFRHLPGFLAGRAKGANFGDGRDNHVVSAFIERLEIDRVMVFSH